MSRRFILLFASLAFVAAAAHAQEQRMPMRSFDAFEFYTENARGLWVEALAVHTETDTAPSFGEVELTTAGLRLAYGLPLGEI